MKKMMTALAAIALPMGLVACGDADDTDVTAEAPASDGTISGEWMADVDSAQFENDNRDYVLSNGTFSCNSCNPPYEVTANGEWQTVDRPGVDSMMVEQVDDNTVRAAFRYGDKDLGSSTWTVSDDGQTLTSEFNDTSGDEAVTGSETFTRTADGPDGSHAMSGQWAFSDIGDMSDAGLRFSYNVEGDQFTSSGNGSSYTATLGGDPVPVEGSNSNVMVAVEQTGDNSYRETYSRDGEALSVVEVSVDGDTLSAVSTDQRDDSVLRYTAQRQ
ncbi:hypothetical protein [Aurantiacibacter rhizosphaerae]|uniref:Lipocalin-like domain-containing protein n=1 Tax=Aurantiacibacter rhizosphaerae TaxID=2691582 RepID=A0A844XIK0_9SPHN|nr:hypothetical protein [Aurantiacibacter rhizosphaerae]MWV29374.1 hypothetical protein [Aurantiacibacter rhizosphaerae]